MEGRATAPAPPLVSLVNPDPTENLLTCAAQQVLGLPPEFGVPVAPVVSAVPTPLLSAVPTTTPSALPTATPSVNPLDPLPGITPLATVVPTTAPTVVPTAAPSPPAVTPGATPSSITREVARTDCTDRVFRAQLVR